MHYFPLGLGPMQESGNSLLRAMQNQSMIPLDLLVREAVQNSLDAALKPACSEVYVDFTIRPHSTGDVTKLFESGIDKQLLSRLFPDGGSLLEIRDKNTEGLTGPIRLEDVGVGNGRGNLLKLVYEIGKTRSEDTSGGSWGIGKTCYFRIGIGLVLYYSRIRLDNHFQERLVACLVEDESGENRLQRDSATGIAWWGDERGAPLTDSEKIAELLSKIGVEPYSGEDTGTVVIVPFLRNDLIPLPDEPVNEESDGPTLGAALPWWLRDYKSYIRMALERWFCARIDNPLFRRGPMLVASINGRRLLSENMQPVFQVLQALYNRVYTDLRREGGDFLDKQGVDPANIVNQCLDLKGVFSSGTSAGRVIAVRLSPEQLKITAPDNFPDPFASIFSPQDRTLQSRPMVAFMRGPGMVIRWDNSADTRSWGGGTLLTAGEQFMVGLFVPESDRELKPSFREKLRSVCQTLEAYLRSCEKADHHQWIDHAGHTVVSRIRAKAGQVIEKFNMPAAERPQGMSLRAARNLADRLLPAGFGQDGRIPPATPSKSEAGDENSLTGIGRRHLPSLEVTRVSYGENEIDICWKLHWGRGLDSRCITLGVDSESGGVISYKEWTKEKLGQFPMRIVGAVATGSLGNYSLNIDVNNVLLIVGPWQKDMDYATISGELKINLSAILIGSIRPVLQVTVCDGSEEQI